MRTFSPPGEVGSEADSERQDRRDVTVHLDRTGRRREDPADQPQQGRLARAIAPDHTDRLASRDT